MWSRWPGRTGCRYSTTGGADQAALRDRALHALQQEGYCGFGDVTVISDGAEILKRLPRAMPTPTDHIIDWLHIAMKIQPMQQIADHIVQSRSDAIEAPPAIDRDIRAVKWRLWHDRVDRAASQPRLATPDLRPLEPQRDHQLRKTVSFRPSRRLDSRWSASGWPRSSRCDGPSMARTC